MPFFSWEQSLSVGVNKFDEEHKVLINYINMLHTGMLSGEREEKMSKVLDGLIEYTETHFKHEQDIMVELGYPEYEAHKKIHENFVAKVVELKNEFNEGKTSISLELMSFLKDWLVNHIQGTDQKYRKFFESNGFS